MTLLLRKFDPNMIQLVGRWNIEKMLRYMKTNMKSFIQ